ncbi:MAG: hypothetical protein A3F46_10715 [Legionellales bacterium RIFCSPHIGHO2_12_FULL_42_9]|nr:MAG: hypothetical protein A3F46_10715 [Legionellales bacterium RIFCSPHIGHO2_12_FULL_42_9]
MNLPKNRGTTEVVIVVDAYSTGKYLPTEIIKRGFSWLHILSRPNLPNWLTTNNKHNTYLTEITYQNNLNQLLTQLRGFNIVAVMAGTETSIELTEQLAQALDLPGNNPATSYLRRNKFYMIDAVNKAGLYTAKQYYTDNINKLIQWYQHHFTPGELIVIKPLNSAGTDRVTFCSSIDEISYAAEQILGKINRLGILNRYVLAQSFLDGQEYVVNTVSVDSKHHLSDIWRCHKQRIKGASFVPGCEVLLPVNGEIQSKLRQYAFNALDVLDFTQGPAHFEIMLTVEGPAIIEVGARIQGGINPSVHLECMGTSQLIKTVDSYLDPEHFLSYYRNKKPLKKWSRWADLIVPASGKVKSFTLIDQLKKLDSFHSVNVNIKPGDYLARTVDLYTSPGSIYLVNEDPIKLEDDYLKLRAFEKESYEFIAS